jgi:hypothetical protein
MRIGVWNKGRKIKIIRLELKLKVGKQKKRRKLKE